MAVAANYLVSILYLNSVPYKKHRTPELNQRDEQIWKLYLDGVHPNDIAPRFGITPPRVYQIISRKKKSA